MLVAGTKCDRGPGETEAAMAVVKRWKGYGIGEEGFSYGNRGRKRVHKLRLRVIRGKICNSSEPQSAIRQRVFAR